MTTTDVSPNEEIGFVAEQIETEARTRTSDRARRADTVRPLLWRLHFIGGFLAAPVIIAMALSGIGFAWSPQLDTIRYGSVVNATEGAPNVPLSEQLAAARSAHPEWKVYAVTPGEGGRNTAVLMDPPGGQAGFGGAPGDGVNVYVDRATGAVTGSVSDQDTTAEFFRTLHSSFRLGANAEPLTELAGSLFFVSLLSGLYLWWPGLRRRGTVAFALRRRLQGRRRSKEWHNFIGVTLMVPMLLLAFTGIAWTQFAADRVGQVSTRLAQPAGKADSKLPAPTPGQQDMANIDKVAARAEEARLAAPVQILVPTSDKTGWKAASGDRTFPVERDQIVVDGATGRVTDTFDYRDEHWYNKLQTAGTLFHQAELFGVPLQVFMTALALAIVAMIVFGYRMWWQRRPAHGMGAPPPVRNWVRNAPIPILVATVVIAWALPVLGLAMVVWLVLEAGWRWWGIARGRHAWPGTPAATPTVAGGVA